MLLSVWARGCRIYTLLNSLSWIDIEGAELKSLIGFELAEAHAIPAFNAKLFRLLT